jgi:hypothetical protein
MLSARLQVPVVWSEDKKYPAQPQMPIHVLEEAFDENRCSISSTPIIKSYPSRGANAIRSS